MRSTTCECCGLAPATEAYAEADASGHAWTYRVYGPCARGCSSDTDGRPVHTFPTGATSDRDT